MIPDNVEKIIMTKEDYDRNVEQLLVDKCKAEQENEKLHSIIKEAREYINDNVVVYAFNGKEFPHWEFNDDNINDILEILDMENI